MAQLVFTDLDFQNTSKILNLEPTTTDKGVVRLATQAEVDAGVVNSAAITPATLKAASGTVKRFAATIGDGTATSIAVTHSLATDDVQVQAYLLVAPKRTIVVEVQRTSVNQVTLSFAVAPAANSVRVVVVG